ncbi:MAG TPA: TolC family protein, partial [Gammaproteobacteria bacterium]|nr:TolC family protein [Gammaproteobacteria bacterium]
MKPLVLFTSLALTACTLYEKPEVPILEVPKDFKVDLPYDNPYLKNNWWENFNDETLNALVEQALEENYNYQIALNNIDVAQTYVSQNRSYLFPQVSAGFNASRNKIVPDEFFGAFTNPGAPDDVTNPGGLKSADPSGNASSSFLNG